MQGAPCWVSLTAHDLEAARDFYAAVMGWEYKAGFQEERNYSVALSHGVPVAGMTSCDDSVGFPVTWTVYFAAESADAVASRIRERSATVAVGPIEFGKGRVALAADPDDAVFGVWEGEIDHDWRPGGESGAPAWLELRTRDPFASALFYGEVFAWDSASGNGYDIGYEYDRVVVRLEGRIVLTLSGGAVEAAPDPHIRPRWNVYFRVDDVNDVTRRTEEAGGTVIRPPHDTPFGRVAALRDPESGLFNVTSGEAQLR